MGETRMKTRIDTKKWDVPSYSPHVFFPKRNDFCLIIPVINEGEKFKKQVVSLKPYTKLVDIIIADGGSTDGSTDRAFLKNHGVRALLIKTGSGRLSAQLRMAYAFALQKGYSGIVTMDGNGKDGPEAIPRFIAALKRGYDLVQGSRFLKGGKAINTPSARLLAIRLIHAPVSRAVGGFGYTDTTNGFRAYSDKLLLDERVQPFRKLFKNYELLVYLSIRSAKLGFSVCEIPVVRQYPKKGKIPTKIRFLRGNADILLTLMKAAVGAFDP